MSNDTTGLLRLQALAKFKKVRPRLEVFGEGQVYLEVRRRNKRIGAKVWSNMPSWTAIAAEAERIVQNAD